MFKGEDRNVSPFLFAFVVTRCYIYKKRDSNTGMRRSPLVNGLGCGFETLTISINYGKD